MGGPVPTPTLPTQREGSVGGAARSWAGFRTKRGCCLTLDNRAFLEPHTLVRGALCEGLRVTADDHFDLGLSGGLRPKRSAQIAAAAGQTGLGLCALGSPAQEGSRAGKAWLVVGSPLSLRSFECLAQQLLDPGQPSPRRRSILSEMPCRRCAPPGLTRDTSAS